MKNVEDIYSLSPMQETMLFHSCTNSSHDVLFNQVCYKIDGRLDQSCFHKAWQAILDRHPVLRTAFVWKGLNRPQQVVRKHLEVPFSTIDLTEQSVAEQQSGFENLCREDRARSFRPEQAPLMRITLVRLNDNTNLLIWSSHHLILDRWCIPIIMDELVSFYEQLLNGSSLNLEKGRAYRDYIGWIQRQDADKSRHYWTAELSGFSLPTMVTRPHQQPGTFEAHSESFSIELFGAAFESLKVFCERHRLTLSTVIQAAWSLLLNRYSGNQDVVFGVVVSGRPVELPYMESMVGSFVNNLPVRTQLASDALVLSWLQDIQRRALRRQAYEYVSLSQLQTWSDLEPARTLFDSIIVWLAPAESRAPESLELVNLAADMRTAYPLTLSVEETKTSLQVSVQLNERFELVVDANTLLPDLRTLIVELIGIGEAQQLGEITGFCGQLNHGSFATDESVYSGVDAPGLSELNDADTIKLPGGREQADGEAFIEYLRSEWQQVLGIEDIPLDENFFHLGGNSLKAVTLLAKIEQGSRKKIPLLPLFQNPTIRNMARVILQEDWPLVPGIALPLKTHGKDPPLFCIASPEVNTIGYSILSRYLSNRPVYVLQAPPDSAEARRIMPSEMADLAAKYLQSMLDKQKVGPYHIIGMCTGAQIGIEMVRQLEAQGHTVGFCGVIDTYALFTLSKLYYVKQLINKFYYYKRRVVDLASQEPAKLFASIRQIAMNKLPDFSKPAVSPDGRVSDAAPTSQISYSLIDEVGFADTKPDIKRYSGTVAVFSRMKHRQQFWRVSDPDLGWAKYANNIEIIPLSTREHTAILREPHVAAIAKQIETKLKKTSCQHKD